MTWFNFVRYGGGCNQSAFFTSDWIINKFCSCAFFLCRDLWLIPMQQSVSFFFWYNNWKVFLIHFYFVSDGKRQTKRQLTFISRTLENNAWFITLDVATFSFSNFSCWSQWDNNMTISYMRLFINHVLGRINMWWCMHCLTTAQNVYMRVLVICC